MFNDRNDRFLLLNRIDAMRQRIGGGRRDESIRDE
jgi:hypothetical protein